MYLPGISRMTYMEGVVYKEVDKEEDEYEAYAVEKELNEGSELEDDVMVMVVEVIMKLTLVMEMVVDKEVDVEVKWEVDEVAKDVSIFRMRLNVFYWNSIKIGESFDSCRRCAKFFSCRKSLKVHMITTRWKWAFCM